MHGYATMINTGIKKPILDVCLMRSPNRRVEIYRLDGDDIYIVTKRLAKEGPFPPDARPDRPNRWGHIIRYEYHLSLDTFLMLILGGSLVLDKVISPSIAPRLESLMMQVRSTVVAPKRPSRWRRALELLGMGAIVNR